MRRSRSGVIAAFGLILMGSSPAPGPTDWPTLPVPTLVGYELDSTGVRRPRVRLSGTDGRSFDALIDDRVLVRLAPEASSEVLRELGLEPVRLVSPSLGIWAARDPGGADALSTVERLARDPGARAALRTVEPNYHLWHQITDFPTPPNDPRYPSQWYLERIDVEAAWAIEAGSAETTVVVIDNGCDLDHPDLVSQLDPGRDVVRETDEPTYEPNVRGNNHGTACAGIVGAAGNNHEGIVGVCPGCRLRCVQLLSGAGGFVSLQDDLDAFEFARSVGAAVVSNSWSFSAGAAVPQLLREALLDLMANGRDGRGTVVVFAVGNENREVNALEISNVEYVVGVGATTLFDEATAFSNRGRAVDLVAPAGTFTTDIAGPDGDDPGDYTNSFGGTSSACPVVAGVAGLLASARPDAHARELEAALLATVRPAPYAVPDETGWDPLYGYGIVNPAGALRRVLGLPEPSDGGVEPRPDGGDGPDAQDAPSTDAGFAADSGAEPGPEPDSGCSATGLAPSAWLLLLLAPALRRRRWARRRER